MAKSTRKTTLNSRTFRRGNATAWLVGAGVLLLIAVPLAFNLSRRAGLPGEGFANQGNTHIETVATDHPDYNSSPPTSGWHTGSLANWGSYDYVVPDELLLHNMEDGGVVLYYPLGTPEENAAELERLDAVTRGSRKAVVAPREDLGSGYVLAAWQRLQRFDALDEVAMVAFVKAFEGIDHH